MSRSKLKHTSLGKAIRSGVWKFIQGSVPASKSRQDTIKVHRMQHLVSLADAPQNVYGLDLTIMLKESFFCGLVGSLFFSPDFSSL